MVFKTAGNLKQKQLLTASALCREHYVPSIQGNLAQVHK